MRAGMRPYVTAGVALVGAGLVAVTPIAPLAADTPAAHSAVQLAAVPSPLQLYPQVVLRSIANAEALVQQYLADPFPIIGKTLENQAVAFADAVAALQSGRVDDFFAAAADIVLQPGASAGAALVHLGAILSQPFALEGFFITAISPVLSGLVATGQAIGEVVDALTSLDLVGTVNAVLNIPARIIDGVLNGVPGASFGIFADLPGLLSPADPESDLPAGPIAVGINLDQELGAAIPPRESSGALDAVPDPDAAIFTLTADSAPVADPAPEDVTTDIVGTESSDAEDAATDAGAAIDDAEVDGAVVDGDEPGTSEDDSETDDGAESDGQSADSGAATDAGPGDDSAGHGKTRGAAAADKDAA
ncbi:Uncharacterised protein [Mycolicibacterium aurum]|uniref:PE-PGRS family protein n=1 Tax=Mycolicibacterium aurum TaxID=1791 RepID=A0A3S4VY99_MYCAU|nr:hypothetical protein [Mycolicibacterium aurum]VEG58190.1 Uncharacterised protein [Mycolicibacterium aurum]